MHSRSPKDLGGGVKDQRRRMKKLTGKFVWQAPNPSYWNDMIIKSLKYVGEGLEGKGSIFEFFGESAQTHAESFKVGYSEAVKDRDEYWQEKFKPLFEALEKIEWCHKQESYPEERPKPSEWHEAFWDCLQALKQFRGEELASKNQVGTDTQSQSD